MMEIPTNLIESTIHRGTIIHSYGFRGIDHGNDIRQAAPIGYAVPHETG